MSLQTDPQPGTGSPPGGPPAGGPRSGPAAPGVRPDASYQVRSYRYLRIAIVGLLLALGTAVIYQRVQPNCSLGSVSAYFYTRPGRCSSPDLSASASACSRCAG